MKKIYIIDVMANGLSISRSLSLSPHLFRLPSSLLMIHLVWLLKCVYVHVFPYLFARSIYTNQMIPTVLLLKKKKKKLIQESMIISFGSSTACALFSEAERVSEKSVYLRQHTLISIIYVFNFIRTPCTLLIKFNEITVRIVVTSNAAHTYTYTFTYTYAHVWTRTIFIPHKKYCIETKQSQAKHVCLNEEKKHSNWHHLNFQLYVFVWNIYMLYWKPVPNQMAHNKNHNKFSNNPL